MRKATIEEMEEMDAMADALRESYLNYLDEQNLNDKVSDSAIESYLKGD